MPTLSKRLRHTRNSSTLKKSIVLDVRIVEKEVADAWVIERTTSTKLKGFHTVVVSDDISLIFFDSLVNFY